LAERTKSSQKDSRIVIDSVFSIIIEKLSNWIPVDIFWFWKFVVSKRAEKKWVNPRTWEPMVHKPYHAVTFKWWKKLKTSVRNILD
jgi:nucleoid DNA-binding protein